MGIFVKGRNDCVGSLACFVSGVVPGVCLKLCSMGFMTLLIQDGCREEQKYIPTIKYFSLHSVRMQKYI